jgi:hypothetical protein
MQRARPSGRVDHRRLTTSALATLVALAAAGCSTGDSLNSGPVLPPEPPQFGQLRAAAFLAEINTQTREVKITPPKTVTVNSHNAWVGPNGSASNDGGTVGSQSLLGGDVITLIASNYAASAVGAFQPGKIRVSFDVSIFNKLSSAQLSTPTFPTPPSSVTGILLFPF